MSPRCLASSRQTANALGDLGKALLDLAPEHLAHARQFLSEAAQQAAHVTLFPVVLLRHLEEATHSLEREAPRVSEAGVEARVHPLHVPVDDLEREVLLVLEVMVEGALRGARRREQGLDAEIVVAVLQEHGQARIEQALLGRMHRLHCHSIGTDRSLDARGPRARTSLASPSTFSIMCSMTWLCSCWGLNMTISASASTFTLWPGGQ